MNQTVIAVIDGTKARFFTLEQAGLPEYESGPNLIEQGSLANKNKELQGKELWANTKTGRNKGSGSQAHGYDDHRDHHLDEFEKTFAKDIVYSLISLTQAYQCQRVVLAAEPQILGFVRDALDPHLPKHLAVEELAKDLCKMKPLEIHEYLANKGLIQARKVVAR
jgi:protein required for attachment to host cells